MDDNFLALNIDFLNAQSRSFAIPISRLDSPLKKPIICQYNINKLMDIIEDSSSIAPVEQKFVYMDQLCDSFKNGSVDNKLLSAMLDYGCIDLDYFQYYPAVIALYNSLSTEERSLGYSEYVIMSFGMKKYLGTTIKTMDDLNDFCFYAAGIVGRYLTELLYITYADVIEPNMKDKLLDYSLSFGSFLQKINNIRDYYEDTFVMKKPRWPKEVTSTNTPLQSLNILCNECVVNNALPAIKYLEMIPDVDKGFENFIRYILYSGLYYFQFLINNPDVLSENKVKVPKEFMVNLYSYVDGKSKDELIKELYGLYDKCVLLMDK